MMVIRLSDTRVYMFSPSSSIICDIVGERAEILVLPDRRRFVVSCETAKRVWSEYGNAPTPQDALARYLSDGLRNGYLFVDEELV